MALIKCPECGKEISDKANACIHCGYPMELSPSQNTTDNLSQKKETFTINKKILYIGIAVLLIIVFLFFITEKNYANNTKTSPDIVQQSKANLMPYFDVLGEETENAKLTVSQEFLDNLSSVELMGYIGTIEHGYSDSIDSIIDFMEWISNTEITEKDYASFILSMNKYFGSEAVLKSYENLSEETYRWIDYDELCMTFCWNENGKVHVRWYLEEELVSSLITPTSSETTFSANSSQNSSTEICVECGNTATYTYTSPFSGKIENYCYTHYKEIKDTLSMMEEDVEKNSYSNNGSGTNSYSGSSARHTDSEAFSCAKAIVKSRLKSPSTAKFCWITDATITHLGNGEYMVTGWVEAQNSFGATLRQTFVVVYTATESGYKNADATLY